MARYKLNTEVKQADPSVIGISSHVDPHRLCWSLNKALDLELARRSDLVNEEDGVRACYAAFEQVIEPEGFRWALVNNHSGSGILVKQHRQIDYFLLLDEELFEDRPDLLERIRSVDLVLAAYPLAFEHLRNGHLLLL